jgi:hypothetical protein
MPILTQVFAAPLEVEEALALYLGIPLGVFDEVATAWGVEVISTNQFRPPNAPGFAGWDRGTEVLRDGTRAYGYDPINERGVPLAVHRERGVALCLVAGSDGSGDPARNPTTKHPRGTVGSKVVVSQMSLAFASPAANRGERNDLETWIVLPFFDWAANLVRYEISCAATIGSTGFINTWHRRIVPGPVEPLRRRRATPEPSEEIDIPVTPR